MIGDEGVKPLNKFNSLVQLDLYGCGIRKKGAELLS